jgi:hypothetical protein
MATVRIQIRRGTSADWTSVNPVLAGGEMGLETDTGQFKFGDGSSAWADLSYALANQIDDYLPLSEKGQPDGVATLDSAGNVPLSQLGLLVDGAPTLLNTLNEIANAIGDDADFATTVTNLIGENSSDIANLESGVETLTNNLLTNGATLSANTYIGDITPTEILALDGVTSNIQDQIGTLTASIATNITAAESYADNAASAALGTAEEYADDAVSTHNALSLNIHGIADTSVLVTQQNLTDHAGDTTSVHGIADTSLLVVQQDLTDHAADTTSVHGIADTTLLATQNDVSTAQSAAEATASSDATAKANTAEQNAKTYADGLAVNYDAAGDAAAAQAAAEATAAADATTKANTAQSNAESYADNAVSTHNSDTTSVHGIADTSKLVTTDGASQTIGGDLTVTGNLVVSGSTTTVEATDLVVSDPLIYIGEGNTANLVDLGLVSSFNDGTYQHAGIVRDASDSKWKLFKGVTDEPTTTINFAQGSLDNLAVAALEATTITPSSGVVFSDGTQTKAGVPSITAITEKTANYTLASLNERDTLIEVNNTGGTAVTITVPADSTVNFPIGTSIDILRTNTGEVTIAGSGATINATPGLKLRAQWSSATLFKRAANTWVLFGDLKA